MNNLGYNVYVAWNWIAIFFSLDASFVVAKRPSEEEKDMTADEVRWDQYPTVAEAADPRAWLGWQATRQLAQHTVETYGRSLEDFLRFLTRSGVRVEDTTRAEVAAYVRELLSRPHPRQRNVVHLDSGAGLANATILLRLSVIRLFFDYLVEEGRRTTNPAGRIQWRRRYGRTPGDAPLVRRHRRLPWIPTEEQWHALLGAMQVTSTRTRLMFALSYDAALRRQELVTLETTDVDPAHRLIRIRPEHAKNRCERVVPYSAPTADLYTAYLRERRTISRARGPLFLSVSNRNVGRPLSIWSWSKTVAEVAREVAAAAVAMLLQKRVGEWTLPVTYRRLKNPGQPLLPRTRLHFLTRSRASSPTARNGNGCLGVSIPRVPLRNRAPCTGE